MRNVVNSVGANKELIRRISGIKTELLVKIKSGKCCWRWSHAKLAPFQGPFAKPPPMEIVFYWMQISARLSLCSTYHSLSA
jgi:hypothetical protein